MMDLEQCATFIVVFQRTLSPSRHCILSTGKKVKTLDSSCEWLGMEFERKNGITYSAVEGIQKLV